MKYIPNLLTIFRIILVPFFIIAYSKNQFEISIAIFVIAGITDLLDGYIARRFHFTSKLGILLDPLADKMMLLAVLFSMSSKGVIPLWISVIMLIKELSLVMTSAIVYLKHERHATPSNKYGKIATASFSLFIFLLLLMPENHLLLYGIYLSIALKILAFTSYISLYLKTHHNNA